MSSFLTLIQMALLSIGALLISPFFWLVIYLIFTQYRRGTKMEILILGKARSTLAEKVSRAVLMGMMGGLIGTIIIMLLGITIHIRDFTYLFPLAILLMLVHIRYICFSYAGGILALSSLIFGVPRLNVSSVMAIIAILHLVECVLIWWDGYTDAVPVFLKDSRFGMIGGFTLQRFWPIPFAVILVALGPLDGAKELNFPDWWPIFKNSFLNMDNISLQLTAVVAALGYGDMAVVNTPKMKSRKSAIRLFVYSIILLIFSVLSNSVHVFNYLAAAFSPIGHEILVLYGQREEKRGIPLFRHRSKGVTILDINPESIGKKMNLQPGDVITQVNNREVNDRDEIQEILSRYPSYIWMEVQKKNGAKKTLEYQDYRNGIGSLGVILVPKESDLVLDISSSGGLFEILHQKLRKSNRNFHQ